MPNLIVDIGNTALKAAWADGMTLGKTFRYQGERITDFITDLISRTKPDVLVISTVRDIRAEYIAKLNKECGKVIIMDQSHNDEAVSHGLPSGMTPDRAASIIASRYLFKGKGCTIFDLGTILTADFIEADGRYAGGNISLGCRTRFKAVNRYSRTLPLLDTPDDFPERGMSVADSVESGIISGMLFEIRGYIDRYPENIVVFTGGDAIYFAKRMKNSIFVVCNLVLMGLALIADEYVKNDN